MATLLTNPTLYFLGLLFLVALAALLKRYRWYLLPVLLPLLGLSYFTLTPLGANFLLDRVALTEAQTDCDFPLAAIIGTPLQYRTSDPNHFPAMSQATFGKVNAAVRWLQADHSRQVIVSGHSGGTHWAFPSDAVVAFNYVQAAGVSPSRLTYNPRYSRSPYESLEHLHALTDARELTIFSSTVDAARIRATFEHHGYKVCMVIADQPRVSTYSIFQLLPSGAAISLTEEVFYEMAATLWYRLTDKI